MVDSSVVKEWLDKAENDLLFAEANLRDEHEFYPQICFHFQQAAEKYLKASIIRYELGLAKVHDLTHLLKLCITHDSTLSCVTESCILLNSAYIETRYPVHWPTNYTRATAEEAHAALTEIPSAVMARINLV